MTRRRRRPDRSRGATVVEFAFVAPVLFLLLFGMLEIGLAVLGRSVASNAAREGARIGIIHFDDADVATSANRALIEAAVREKLVGLIAPAGSSGSPFVEVRCLAGATKTVKPCDRDTIAVGFDLVEVQVRWRSISPTGGFVTASSFVDRARMVIVGDGASGPGAPTSTGTIRFAATAVSTTETNGPSTVQLTVTRSNGAGLASVAYATAPGTATSDVDYTSDTSLLSFLDGETTKTITIPITGDGATEPTETFTVTLSTPTPPTMTIEAGQGAVTVSIVDDDLVDLPPALVNLRMFDQDSDGRVDLLTADFDEALQTSCPTPAAFQLANVPSGGTPGAVTISGQRATIVLGEGAGPEATGVGAFTVALQPGCVRDAAGGSATFTARAPTDLAAPRLLSASDSNGANDGLAEPGDTLRLRFSEPIANAPTTSNVQVVDLGGADGLVVPGLLAGQVALNGNYADRDLAFNGSSVAASGNDLVLTLGACSTNGQCYTGGNPRALAGTSSSVVLIVSGGLADGAGNIAYGSASFSAGFRLF